MSKKHKYFNQSGPASNLGLGVDGHTEEYQSIKMDLVRVALVNAIFLAAVLILYYTNRSSGFLEKLAARYLSF